MPRGSRLLEQQLQAHDYLTGNQFSIADAYLFTALNRAHDVKFEPGRWPAVQGYLQRVAVRAAMTVEGLIKQ